MNRHLFLLSFLAIPLACLADNSPLDPVRESAPADRLVVLRSGGVFEGQITKEGNWYLVKLGNGEVRIRAADVEMTCPDLKEAYQRKKALAQGGNLQNHLQLAQWCQQQGLNPEAEEELTAAETIAPRHPLVQLLKQKLKAGGAPAVLKPHPPAGSSPSSEELDRMIRGLPPKTVELYTRSVQPVLMNNCTAGGCHGPQSTTKLRLFRMSQDQFASRRLTQRNLHMVLQFIDQGNPAASPLLKVPAGPHGSMKAAIFNEHQKDQYQKIVDWAMQFDPAAVGETTPLPSPKASADKVIPATHEEPVAEAEAPAPPPASHSPRPKHAQKIKRGAEVPQFTPKDEFDPELFNRRYFPSPPPSAGAPDAK
jgi:hypothetical protein